MAGLVIVYGVAGLVIWGGRHGYVEELEAADSGCMGLQAEVAEREQASVENREHCREPHRQDANLGWG